MIHGGGECSTGKESSQTNVGNGYLRGSQDWHVHVSSKRVPPGAQYVNWLLTCHSFSSNLRFDQLVNTEVNKNTN